MIGQPEDMTSNPEPFTLRTASGLASDPPILTDATILVIDVQKEYESDGLLPLTRHSEAIGNITKVLSSAREQGVNIVHIVHEGSAGGAFDPARGGRTSTAANPIDGETTISKMLPNAFAGTHLHDRLQELDAKHLVIIGFMTHMCVSSTARAALDLGYATTVVSDATASRDLPSAVGGQPVEANAVHETALASLADRFSIIASTAHLLIDQ